MVFMRLTAPQSPHSTALEGDFCNRLHALLFDALHGSFKPTILTSDKCAKNVLSTVKLERGSQSGAAAREGPWPLFTRKVDREETLYSCEVCDSRLGQYRQLL